MSDSPASRTQVATLEHPSAAIASLILGILGLFALPLIGPILALVFGYQSRRLATSQPDVYRDDLGRIGRILGWIGIGFVALGLVAVTALMPVR